MKKTNLFILLAVCVLFTSCLSLQPSENIITYLIEEGQTNYMSQTSIPVKNNAVKEVVVDITYVTKNKTVVSDPVVNYTVTLAAGKFTTPESAELSFNYNNQTIKLENKSVFFKKLDKNKNLLIRFTTNMKAADFHKILKESAPVKLEISVDNANPVILESKEISQKFDEARMMF